MQFVKSSFHKDYQMGLVLVKKKAVITILWPEHSSLGMDTGSRIAFRKSELPLQESSFNQYTSSYENEFALLKTGINGSWVSKALGSCV